MPIPSITSLSVVHRGRRRRGGGRGCGGSKEPLLVAVRVAKARLQTPLECRRREPDRATIHLDIHIKIRNRCRITKEINSTAYSWEVRLKVGSLSSDV